MRFDMVDILCGGFIGLVVLLLIGLIGGAALDGVQDYRSFDAQAACQARRMQPLRRSFSARIVCVPVNTRQDTTTVRLDTPR